MQITTAIIALVATAVYAVSAEEGIIRTPLIKNPNHENVLEVAKRRYQSIQRRSSMLTKRDPFQSALYNDQGSQYLINVGIGSPAQNFSVTLDTGSADLWVPSTDCPATSCPFYRFKTSDSSTFKSMGKSFGIQYGIGSVNGTYATDTVTVGGATVSNQQFGIASSSQDIFQTGSSSSSGSNSGSTNQSTEANGILGMGYPSLTQASSQGEGAYNPFVFSLVSQKIIKEPIFSIYLNSVNKAGWSGEIIFGGVDDTKYTGNISYLPVAGLSAKPKGSGLVDGNNSNSNSNSNANYYYWMVYGQGLGVSNNNNGSNPAWRLRELGAFILDTGTTLTYLPTSVATEVVTAFAGAKNFVLDRQSGVFIVDCATAKSKARFNLQMSPNNSISNSPVVLSVPASELVIPLDGANAETARTCLFGIAPMGGSGSVGSNMYLIGDSVLRSAYMVFDMGQNRVGLAAAKDIGGTVTTGSANSSSSINNASTASASTNIKSSIMFTISALGVTALSMSTL